MSSSTVISSPVSSAATAASSISRATCCCLPRKAMSRRTRSIALLRPTLTSQARGLEGGPSGQRASAMANASCRASSARSKSPTRRISVASTRPASLRKMVSTSLGVMAYATPRSVVDPDRPDFDRAVPGARNPCRDRQCRIEILGLDQVIAAKLLVGLRERPVGGEGLAVAHPHRGRRRDRLQPVAGLEIAALDDGLGERAIFLEDLLAGRGIHFAVVGFILIDHQQVLHRSNSIFWSASFADT